MGQEKQFWGAKKKNLGGFDEETLREKTIVMLQMRASVETLPGRAVTPDAHTVNMEKFPGKPSDLFQNHIHG